MSKKLSEILDVEIDRMNGEANRHKRHYRVCQTLVIALSATSSVVAAWALKQEQPSKDAYLAIVIVTALSTAISAWLEMRKSRDLWQHERPVVHALKDLKRELDFLESIEELTVKKKKEMFHRIAQILGQAGEKWVRLSKEKEPGAESAPTTGAAGGAAQP